MKTFAALVLAAAVTAAVTPPALAQTVLAHRGASVNATLEQTLDSGRAHDGDTFALVAKDTFFTKAGPLKGATIEGHIESVTSASPRHKASMNIIFDDVKMADGTTAAVRAHVASMKELEPKTHKMRDATMIVGGAVAGHMLSKKTGKKGGTLAGAAAGFMLASSMKSNIVLKRGTVIKLTFDQDVIAGSAVQ